MCKNLNSKLIKIPKNVTISIEKCTNEIVLSNEHNTIKLKLNKNINIIKDYNYITLQLLNNNKENKKYLGLYASLLKKNMKGVAQKFKLNLYLNGIGFKVNKLENRLIFKLGYSHDIIIDIPEGIEVSIIKKVQIFIYGSNWGKLTQFAHTIKRLKKVEPYKGKGILLKNEKVLRKEGKKNKK